MGNNVGSPNRLQLDALREISSIGAGNAVTALSQFVGKKVEMAPPAAVLASAKEIPQLIPAEITMITMVILEILGAVGGHILFIFEQKNALSLIDLLMGKRPDSVTTTLSEIDISALKEVASVMSGAYLGVLGDMTNKTLKMTPPFCSLGVSSEISDFIITHSLKDEEITVCLNSHFWISGHNVAISGYIILIPLSSSLRILLRLLGMEGDNAKAYN